MRLREMLTRVQTFRAMQSFTQTSKGLPDNVTSGMQLGGLMGYADALQTIREIPLVQNEVADLLRHQFLASYVSIDPLHVPASEGQAFVGKASNVSVRIAMLEQVLLSVVEPEKPTTFAVFLPHAKAVDKLATEVTEVSEYLSHFSGFHFDDSAEVVGQIELAGFDVGSEWLVFLVQNPQALKLIGLVIAAAMGIIDWSIKKAAEVESLRLMNEDTRNAVEDAKKLRRARLRALADNIKTETNSPADNEEVSRLSVMIDRTSEMVERRYVLQATRNALSAAKDAWPAEKEQEDTAAKLLEAGVDMVKQLGAGNSEEK
jgi:hypothetical protein